MVRYGYNVMARRLFSGPPAYPEALQAAAIKPLEFYEVQAAQRRYFYFIDLQGRLFLENTLPKTIATSLKSPAFLRFFFRQLRTNTGKDAIHTEYPWISPCGNEMNFIKAQDTPMVYDSLSSDFSTLTFACGSMTAPFQPASLSMSLTHGHLYHPVASTHYSGVALLASHVALQLGPHIDTHGDVPVFTLHGTQHPVAIVE